MAEPVRFGIVGLGMGRGRADLVPRTSGAKLVAVCDIWEERALKAKEELGCEWIRDYDEMLARDDIDVVGVFTPSGMHCAFVEKALRAGKHAFTTKPMDIHVAACDAAIKAAEETGLILAVDFESRYHAVNHQIRDAVQSGALGQIIFADLRMKWFRSQDYYATGWPAGWRSRLQTEGGSLANQAVHYLDLLQWWLGPVETVYGRRGTFAHNIETEDASLAMLEFASGTLALVLTTTCAFPDQGTAIGITGATGTLNWKDNAIELFARAKGMDVAEGQQAGYVRPEFASVPEAVTLAPEQFNAPPDLPKNIIEDMVRAVTTGAAVQCDGYEGRKSVALVEAVYESSDLRAPVRPR